jgi:hypothetical protein
MQVRKTSVILRLALAALLAASPVTVALAQTPQNGPQREGRPGTLTVPVSGLVGPEGSTPTIPFTGTFTIQRFARSDQGLAAVGIFVANVQESPTSPIRTIATQLAVPVVLRGDAAVPVSDDLEAPDSGPAAIAQAQACSILHLVLGPLDLNLLGLRIQLNQVVLDITAVPGPGNLLGNLLCAITGLLDNPSPLARLIALLNQLLDVLG